MLDSSTAYNLAADSPRRGLLRRIDHAAIFLMIAGTCTPFTTCRLHGPWAIGMTAAVWTGAGASDREAPLSAPRRANLDRGLPDAGVDDPGGSPTHARRGGRPDRAFDWSWGRALFHRGRISTFGGSCRSSAQYGTASCWSQPAVITRLSCTAWCWCDREPLRPDPKARRRSRVAYLNSPPMTKVKNSTTMANSNPATTFLLRVTPCRAAGLRGRRRGSNFEDRHGRRVDGGDEQPIAPAPPAGSRKYRRSGRFPDSSTLTARSSKARP